MTNVLLDERRAAFNNIKKQTSYVLYKLYWINLQVLRHDRDILPAHSEMWKEGYLIISGVIKCCGEPLMLFFYAFDGDDQR